MRSLSVEVLSLKSTVLLFAIIDYINHMSYKETQCCVSVKKVPFNIMSSIYLISKDFSTRIQWLLLSVIYTLIKSVKVPGHHTNYD